MYFKIKSDAEKFIKDFGLINARIFAREDKFYELIPKKIENVKLIKNWKELASLNLENENFKVEINIDNGNGYIRSKKEEIFDDYLSTHTFYGLNYKISTLMFQLRGFMVEIDNWDKEN